MPRYYFTQYESNYFSIDADSEADAWSRYYDGDYEVSDSDISETEITDVQNLESESAKVKVGEATRLPFPDAAQS